jgi:hypothetical protein
MLEGVDEYLDLTKKYALNPRDSAHFIFKLHTGGLYLLGRRRLKGGVLFSVLSELPMTCLAIAMLKANFDVRKVTFSNRNGNNGNQVYDDVVTHFAERCARKSTCSWQI